MNTVRDTAPSVPDAGASTLKSGDIVGNYRLVETLGAGGMGQVFLAQHLQLNRRVAVKTLRPQLAANKEAVRRFFNEGQIVSDLKHEHIVDLMDFGQDARGRVYFVMELLEGADLCAARERDGPFPVARAVSIIRQVAATMSAVHARKIIHRDLKPENIFLATGQAYPDFVKLLDFGLAKLSQSSVGVGEATQIGAVLGTPDYMSPEQAQGMRVDWRTDIYSAGTILYWMLTDQLPFRAATLTVRPNKRDDPAPPLPAQTAGGAPIPRALAELVASCLERDPGARPRTFKALIEELDQALRAPSFALATSWDDKTQRTRRGWPGRWLGVAAAAVAALAAFGWLALRRTGAPAAPVEPPAAAAAPPAARLPPPDVPRVPAEAKEAKVAPPTVATPPAEAAAAPPVQAPPAALPPLPARPSAPPAGAEAATRRSHKPRAHSSHARARPAPPTGRDGLVPFDE
ncbi:MAG TPA: serine/threonine-protein kinase [Myxococcales bacterium]|nr:serine/threonine-protein kinase [Myxococcales bacterium]